MKCLHHFFVILAGDEAFPVCQRCSKAQRYCDRAGRLAPASKRLDRNGLTIENNVSLDKAPRKALESSELANYFRHYINNVAMWYDLSDSQCQFSTEVPAIALDEPLLFYAVIALSAMHVSQTTVPSARSTAEAYHTRCIRRLIDLEPEDVLIKKGVALATTCLLRSYEILAEGHDPNRHLKGAFSLASQLRGVLDHPSGGLLHSGFWNYLREDITFSLFGNCTLKIDLGPIPRLRNVLSDQDRLNAISLALGRIVNTMIGSTVENARNSWATMLSYVEDWLLPAVHMLKACHAASWHYCLVSLAILTMHARTVVQVEKLASLVSSMGIPIGTVKTGEDLLEHIGLEICGIAFTSNEPPVLVNAFGPISYCAKYIRTEASQQELRLFSTQRLPQVVRPSAEEIQRKRLSERNLEIAVRSVHLDGLVVVEDVVPHEHLDHLNAKMVGDARVLQARGEDSPFNYNVGNIQQDAPPYAEYFYPSIFTSCATPILTS
ncbi:hypothetical protein NUW58_g8465 [Xylaria curta]|uniref:Uncharacterized protein n=1 Tax=Xylaria curta TaxID=42375 RepID=A0ACC1N7L9_9PEZI|nr:hypothetical protein NUW58_g8465 [Xylaria curta]